MTDESFHLTATGAAPLEQAVREALAAEGRPPAKKRVRAWIRAGDVEVEGRAALDPAFVPAAGDRVVVTPGRGRAEAAGDASCTTDTGAPETGAPGAGAGCAASIRHLDAHLLVAEWEPTQVVGSDESVLVAWLRAGLEACGVKGRCPRPVPDPVLRVGGLVAAALTPTAEARLGAAQGEGAVRLELTVLAEVRAEVDASGLELADAFPGVVRAVREGPEEPAAALHDLRARNLAPLAVPGPGPADRRPLLAHVTGLALPHPSTGRALAWTSPLPPTFAAPEA